jgi:hypothetical protein
MLLRIDLWNFAVESIFVISLRICPVNANLKLMTVPFIDHLELP